MILRTTLLTVALLATACGACGSRQQPSTLSDAVLLQWSVSQGLWGSEVVEVRADRSVIFRFEPAGPDTEPRDEAGRISQAELDSLLEDLDDAGICGLSSGRHGVPDEGKPTLQVRSGELNCRVELWDGEWREDGPEALRVVQRLREIAAE